MSSEYFGLNDMAEGAACEIFTRRPDHKGLAKNPLTHRRAWLCELSQNSSLEVSQSPVYNDEQKAQRDSLGIHYQAGDKLRADKITIYVECQKKPAFKVREGMSATHGGNICSTRNITLGVIKLPFFNLQSKFPASVNPKMLTENEN